MKRICLLASFLVACAGSQAKTTINTSQDFEQVVNEVVERVLVVFQDGGINCNMISGELRAIDGSQRMEAVRMWRKDHPEATETMKAAVAAKKPELEKAMGPAARQCGGPIQTLVQKLTE